MRVASIVVTSMVIEDGTTAPPELGQRVEWTLELLDTAGWPHPPPVISLLAEATPSRRDPVLACDEWPTRLRNDQLRCQWIASSEVRGWVQVSGVLVHRLSGGMVSPDLGLTAGVVRRIRVTRTPVAQDDRGTWHPSPSGEETAYDVTESPRWFVKEQWDSSQHAHLTESGLLVDLDINMHASPPT